VSRIDQHIEEWIQKHNLAHIVQLEELLKRIVIFNEMKRKNLNGQNAGRVNQDTAIKEILLDNPRGKRPFGRSCFCQNIEYKYRIY